MAFLNKSASTVQTLWRMKDIAKFQRMVCQLKIQTPVSMLHTTSRTNTTPPADEVPTLDGLRKKHYPTDFEKKMLVWAKIYPKVEEVPSEIVISKMVKAKDFFRIRFSIAMVIATLLASMGYVASGKQALSRGESVAKMNLEWQQKNREEVQAQKRKEREAQS